MKAKPKSIQLNDIAPIIAERFRARETVTCYVGSNAATPTASLEALSESVKVRQPKLPF
jgi:hypothetical protein